MASLAAVQPPAVMLWAEIKDAERVGEGEAVALMLSANTVT